MLFVDLVSPITQILDLRRVLHSSSKTSEIPASAGSGTSLEEEDLSLRTTRTVPVDEMSHR